MVCQELCKDVVWPDKPWLFPLNQSVNQSLGVSSPLCILELCRPIHIDMAVKNTTIFM